MPEDTNIVKLDDELKDALKDIVKSCEAEDRELRKSMIRTWKKAEEFWHGVQYLFWSDTDETWKSPLNLNWGSDDTDDSDQLGSFSDKVIDIYKAHGEAIISALSAQIPSIRFSPDDADDEADVLTARTKSKIADLVTKHNKIKLVFLRALYFLANQGIIASYRYKDSDFKYGSYEVPKYGVEDQEIETYTCDTCGYQSNENWQITKYQEQVDPNQENPEEENQQIQQVPNPCPRCGSIDKPKKEVSTQQIPVTVGTDIRPKTRVKIDIFGPLFFKVSTYARSLSECSYFILYGDPGKDIVKSNYPDYADEIESEHLADMDRFSRSNYSAPSDPNEDAQYLVTVKKIWLRPSAFYRCKDKEKIERLKKKFPNGARFTLIGKRNVFPKEDIMDESMDYRWTIGKAGLSTYIYSDPILRPLIQIQEMRNQLVNLIMETISHGIPSTFADPKVVSFDIYGKYEALPGFIYKAVPAIPGGKIGDSFYTSDRATISREVGLFLAQLDKDAQFTVGSFPSIYGGPSEGKSRTLGEYEASRKQALQRLSIVWSLVVDWYVSTIEGLVDMYVECVNEDERFTVFQNGNYINVWIKMSELQGKTGGVEAEASENFPVSLAQKQIFIQKLMEMKNPYVDSVLYNPENSQVLKDIFALTELKIPGEAQRAKQYGEISDLIKAGESGIAPINGLSAVQPDANVDDSAVHIAVLKGFMVDPIGLDIKKFKPMAYAQLEAHLLQHMQILNIQTKANVGTPAGIAPETTKVGADE